MVHCLLPPDAWVPLWSHMPCNSSPFVFSWRSQTRFSFIPWQSAIAITQRHTACMSIITPGASMLRHGPGRGRGWTGRLICDRIHQQTVFLTKTKVRVFLPGIILSGCPGPGPTWLPCLVPYDSTHSHSRWDRGAPNGVTQWDFVHWDSELRNLSDRVSNGRLV